MAIDYLMKRRALNYMMPLHYGLDPIFLNPETICLDEESTNKFKDKMKSQITVHVYTPGVASP